MPQTNLEKFDVIKNTNDYDLDVMKKYPGTSLDTASILESLREGNYSPESNQAIVYAFDPDEDHAEQVRRRIYGENDSRHKLHTRNFYEININGTDPQAIRYLDFEDFVRVLGYFNELIPIQNASDEEAYKHLEIWGGGRPLDPSEIKALAAKNIRVREYETIDDSIELESVEELRLVGT